MSAIALLGWLDRRERVGVPRHQLTVNRVPLSQIDIERPPLVGDFYQLPPVLDAPLTSLAADKLSADVALTRRKFHDIPHSVILSKSMRAADDKPFADLQMRLRSGTCTVGDVAALNARRVARMCDQRIIDAIDGGAKCIVSDNGLRDALNGAMAHRWASRRRRELRLYAAHDVRTRKRIDDDGNRATRADIDAASTMSTTTTNAQRRDERAPLTAVECAAVARVDTQHAAKLPDRLCVRDRHAGAAHRQRRRRHWVPFFARATTTNNFVQVCPVFSCCLAFVYALCVSALRFVHSLPLRVA